MRLTTASSVALALAASLVSSLVLAVPKVGEPAPAFSATDSKGKALTLGDYKGKYVVLEWTNADCPFVKKHYGSGNMQSTQKAAVDQGAVWLSVISSAPGKQGHVDGAQANALTAARSAAPTQVLLDPKGELGRLYEAKTTPHIFIINPEGKLIYAGAIDDTPSADTADIAGAKNYVKTALAEAKAGKPVTDAVTQPYGCSVKY